MAHTDTQPTLAQRPTTGHSMDFLIVNTKKNYKLDKKKNKNGHIFLKIADNEDNTRVTTLKFPQNCPHDSL